MTRARRAALAFLTPITPVKEHAMKYRILALAVSLAAGNSLIAAPVTYTLDPAHSQVTVGWSHFGLSSPTATFGQLEGTLVYDADALDESSVRVTIPLSSLEGHDADFNEHLRSKDFFEADKYPKATFESTRVESAGEGKLRVTGDLKVKDKSAPVTLDVTVNTIGPHPMSKTPAAGFDATATIKRSDFGVGAYAPNVSDEVKLMITVEALEAKAYAERKAQSAEKKDEGKKS